MPFSQQLAQGTAKIAGLPDVLFHADTAGRRHAVADDHPEVEANTVSFTDGQAFMVKMAADVDSIWYKDYNRLQADVAKWQPPGSFEVHASTLRQAYEAFLTGGHEVEGTIYVLEGLGPSDCQAGADPGRR